MRENQFYESQSDLWYFFVYKAHDLLQREGQLVFIVSNYFIQAGHADTLRLFITNHAKIFSIVNFADKHVFDNVGVHNAIISLGKQTFEDYDFPYINCNDLCKLTTNDNITHTINKSALGKTWRLLSNTDNALLNKLLGKGQSLDSFTKISNGIKSGGDSIFLVKYTTQVFPVEDNLLRDYLKNSEIHRYYIDKPIRKIIYTSSNTVINDYPLLKKYLRQYKKQLEDKWEKRGETNGYWKLYRAREDIYNSGKQLILTPYRTNKFGFTLNNGCFSGTDTYLILNLSQRIGVKALLGILNSKLILWIYERIGKKKGNMLEIATRELSLLPILISELSESQEELLVNLVDIILAKKETGEDSTAEEARIDQMVYKLYDLTKEEIAIVEGR